MINSSSLQNDFQETDYNDSDISGLIHNEWGKASENDLLTDTLDEPVSKTLLRDLKAILIKFKHVFMPTKSEASRSLLSDWDLWGPLLVCCLLGGSLHDDETSNLFTLVFILIGVGSLVVTWNTKLLGGTVSVLQSMCVLGYCLGPLTISLPVVKTLRFVIGLPTPKFSLFMKFIVVLIALVWSCYAALNFMVDSIASSRKALAVYPICLFYSFVAWMIVTQ